MIKIQLFIDLISTDIFDRYLFVKNYQEILFKKFVLI
jgi:hypothetical protein